MVRVYAMRHGQSTWQTICPISPYATAGLAVPCTLCHEQAGCATHLDHLLFDPPLSDAGIAQARARADEVAALGVEAILVSPYRRAIQTGLIVLEAACGVKFAVEPLIRERVSDPCDPGRPASELANEFPSLDFSRVPERWWHDGPQDARGVAVESHAVCQERADAFRTSVGKRSETALLVVSHSGFLRSLTGQSLDNGELVEVPV